MATVSRRWLILDAVAFALVAGFGTALAQSVASGTIHGTIKDESGGVLPGVTATLTSPALQVGQVVQVTDTAGDYRFVDLPAGTYRLKLELPGFSTLIREDLRLTIGFVARLDGMMKVGAMEESVTVSGQGPVVDVTTTSTSTTLTQEVLTTTPRGRGMTDIFAMTPGVTTAGTPDVGDSNLASRQGIENYGVGSQPKLQVEGINITDSAQTSSGVYFTAFSFEEVQIKTSGNDAEVSTPGISMVAVLKSGGNQFHGTYSASVQRPELESNNLSDELRAQGLSQTQPLKYYYDVAGDLGGRIIRDRLWFYGAWNRQERVSGLVGFAANPGPDGRYLTADDVPATYHSSLTVSTMKFSYQLTKANRLTAVWQPSLKLQPENGAGRFRPLEATRDYRNPTSIYKGEIQSTINARTLLNVVAGYGGYIADYSADRGPYEVPGKPSVLDRETGLRTGGHESSNQQPRDRWQVDGSISFFPESFPGGRHELKVGTALYWEHAALGKLNHAHGNYVLYLDRVGGVSGQPVEIDIFNYPFMDDSRATTYAAYLKDTWRLTDRVTANLGVRWERQHSFLPEQSYGGSAQFPTLFPAGTFSALDVLTWTRTVPRVGLAWDLDGKTVVKTTFGIYNHMIGDEFATAYNKNAQVTARFRWRDLDGNRNYAPGEVNLDLNGSDFLSITGAANNLINPDLRQPMATEVTASFERELMQNLGFRVLYVFKRRSDDYATTNILRPRSAYNVPMTRRDPGPDGVLDTGDDGRSVTIYDYDPAFRGAAFVGDQRQNSENTDNYQTMEFTLTKRTSGRWGLVGSFWAIKNHRWITRSFDDPNNDYFPLDDTWEWAATANGSYQLGRNVMISGYLQSKTGTVGQRTNVFRTIDPDGGPRLNQLGTVTLRLEPYGQQRGPSINIINLRASKRFSLGGARRIDIDFDVFNMLNPSTPTSITWASGPTFGYASNVVPARVARLGTKFSF
jgi:hypothetical protein